MSIRRIHVPNSGEIQLEKQIYGTVAENFVDLDLDTVIVAGTKLYFPTHSDNDVTSKVLLSLQKYGVSIEVLHGKPYLAVKRPQTYPLWQKGIFKIYTGFSLILSLYYLVPLLQIYFAQ